MTGFNISSPTRFFLFTNISDINFDHFNLNIQTNTDSIIKRISGFFLIYLIQSNIESL